MPRIKVRKRDTGQIGTIEDWDFDSNLFERIEEPAPTTTPQTAAQRGFIERWNLLPIAASLPFLMHGNLPGAMIAGGAGETLEQLLFRRPRGEGISPLAIAGEAGMAGVSGLFGKGLQAGVSGVRGLLGAGVSGAKANILARILPALGQAVPEERAIPQVATRLAEQPIQRGLAGIGQAIRGAVVKPIVKPFTAASAKLEAQLTNVARAFFRPGSSAAAMRTQSSNWLDIIQGQIMKALPGVKETVPLEAVESLTNEALENTINKGTTTFARTAIEWLNRIETKAVGEKLSAASIYGLKNQLHKGLARAFAKGASNVPLTAQEEAAMAIWDSLDTVMATKFASIKALTVAQSALHRLAPGLALSAGAAQPFSPGYGGLFQTLMTPFRQPLQAGIEFLGRGMEAVGEQQLSPLMAGATQALPRWLLGGQLSPGMPTPTPEEVATISPMQQVAPELAQQMAPQAQAPDPQQIAMLMLQYPKYATLFGNIYKMLQTAARGGLTAVEQQRVQEAQMGLNMVDALQGQYELVQQEGLTAIGPDLGLLGGLRGTLASLRQTSPTASTYEDVKGAFLSRLSRAAGERGVLTDRDIERIARAIPGFYDTPETAAGNWRLIRTIIGSAIQSYRGAGEETEELPY